MRTSRWRSGSGLAGLLAAAGLAGCGVGSSSPPVSMMGDHFASLSCAGPSTLPSDPGTRVTITLTDLGMAQRMGGTAPMGARMTLRVAPARVAAGSVTLAAVNLGWRTHELVVLPLAAGASVGQRVPGADGRIDETGSVRGVRVVRCRHRRRDRLGLDRLDHGDLARRTVRVGVQPREPLRRRDVCRARGRLTARSAASVNLVGAMWVTRAANRAILKA